MEPVKLGVISVAGHFIKRVVVPLKQSSNVEIAAIASRSAEKAKEAAEEWSIPKWYGSYDELLADDSIEMVYIPLPNHMHQEWIKKSADAGKHILCEKPLAMSAGEARESVEYARSKGVLIMEAFMYRFHPQWQHARNMVKSGEIGEVQSIHTFFGYNNKNPRDIRNILEAGGGGIPDIGCYAVSSARFLMGAEPKRVVSLVERDPEFKTDILSSGMMNFGSARCMFTVATQTFPYQRVTVHGSGGTLDIEVPFNIYPDVPMRMTIQTSVGSRDVMTGPVDQYQLQFDAFARAVREGNSEPTPAEDAINNQKVLDAVFRSEKSGSWENV